MGRSEKMGDYPLQRADVETYLLPDGSCVLFDPRVEEGFTLNAAGALVWEYCDAALSTEEIAREVASLLPNEPEAYADGLAVISQLLELDLLDIRFERVSSDVAESQQPRSES
jgi:Coenzyme PQQ synthesis protein D (PqqD)